jgi:hypothetical protein
MKDLTMHWEWVENSVLHEISNNIPPKDIFVAVCAEIGRCYREKGFRFTESRPKLTFQADDIQLEIGFNSSQSNKAGEFVCFEIIPTFYYVPYIKAGIKGRGILFDHSDISSEYDLNKNDIQCVLVGIYGDTATFANHAYPNEKVRYSHMCDVHDMNTEKFLKITDYINTRIIPWLYKITTVPGVEEMITLKRAQRPDWNLQNSNDYVNCSFAYYICERFPELAKKWKIDSLDAASK